MNVVLIAVVSLRKKITFGTVFEMVRNYTCRVILCQYWKIGKGDRAR